MPVNNSTNRYGTAQLIVAPTIAEGANYTTIASAITSASSGDTIFIRPGTYTENLTLKAGVNLVAFIGDGDFLIGSGYTSHVYIQGQHTVDISGMCSLGNIHFVNGGGNPNLFTISGTGLTSFNLNNCYLECGATQIFSYTNSNAGSHVQVINCMGNLTGAGCKFLTMSSIGQLSFLYCNFTNSIQSFVANDISAGTLTIRQSTFLFPFTTSGTSSIGFIDVAILCTDATCLTVGGSGAHSLLFCHLNSGSASAISISSTLTSIQQCTIASSNTNCITGGGTINYSGLEFVGTSSNINTTTQTVKISGPSASFGSTNTGNTNTLTVTNPSNSASSATNILSVVAGATAADPTHQSSVSGITTWTWGIDNSVTSPTVDPWVLAQGTALGTNNVMSVATSGEINYPLQPAFLAYLASSALNKTGNGGVYTLGTDALTEVYDQGNDFNTNGTFTAPVTGRYFLSCNVTITGCTIATGFTIALNTINRTYQNTWARAALSADQSMNICSCVDMNAGHTATITLAVTGEAANTVDILGSSAVTNFSGYLIC